MDDLHKNLEGQIKNTQNKPAYGLIDEISIHCMVVLSARSP